jgi:hypothetical protein
MAEAVASTVVVPSELVDIIGSQRLRTLHAAILHEFRTIPVGGTVMVHLNVHADGKVSTWEVGRMRKG